MPFRSGDDVWDEIVATLELGTGLRFVITETEDEFAARALRRRLENWLLERGQKLASPADGENVLDWLNKQQRESSQEGLPDVVRWLPLPEGYDGKFVLHRLNEGRDNLRRNLRGVLFLVSGAGLVPWLANEAPDLWSVREKVVEIKAPQPTYDLGPPIEIPTNRDQAFTYDVYLDYSYRDEHAAEKLRRRLERDGIKVATKNVVFREGFRASVVGALILQCRFIVPLLSPSYMTTHWPKCDLERLLERDRNVLNTRILPIMVIDSIPPRPLRHLAYLRGRTQESMDAAYAKLLRILREARNE